MNRKVSIIVPVYNAEKYIGQCMESILVQTYKNLEVLCIDDGSTDSSLKILEKYAGQDDRVVVLRQENQGVSQSRNYAFQYVTGGYVMYIDSDDWISPETCEMAIQEAEKEEADLVFWAYAREYPDQTKEKELFHNDRILFGHSEVREKLQRRICGLLGSELSKPEDADSLVTVWGKLYRTELIRDNQIEFVDIKKVGTAEDALFNLCALGHVRKAVYRNQFCYHYRKDNRTSLTSSYKSNFPEQWKQLFALMEAYIKENSLGKEFEQALNNRISMGILGQGLNVLESGQGFRKRYTELKRIMGQPRYREAYRTLTLTYFPLHWKYFYGSAKYGFTLGVYVLLLCIRRMIGR